MAKRNETIDNLKINDSLSAGGKTINDVAQGVAGTDAVNVDQLNSAVVAGGWDEAVWDDTTGDLEFKKSSITQETVNLDGRYLTEQEVQDLIDAQSKNTYVIKLPSASTVAGRIAGAIEVPTGWILTDAGLDLDITHNLSRGTADVRVWAVSTGSTKQVLLNTAAWSGLQDLGGSVTRVQGLATILKEIWIYVTFE